MADQPKTREELYERIRKTSKEEFILEDMIRLGFWPRQGAMPHDPAEEIRRRGELERDLAKLRQEQGRLYNEQALLKELRKRRLLESRKKKQETKERRLRERQERAAAWRERKGKEILFLGEGVSGGLPNKEARSERLRQHGLPELSGPEALAAALGLSIGTLRFLAFSRRVAPVSHYVRFKLPKKTGGERLISAPMPRLKQAQKWVLDNILARVPMHEAAHGFRPGRSIVSNAAPHLGHDVVINADLKDFFPTVSYPRVKGLFRALGYSESVATVLGLLCTEPDVEEVELFGRRWFVALSERHLPQGAPGSPAITNLLCRRLDRRLLKMAAELGFTYTRYADDLSLSASGDAVRNVGKVLRRLAGIVAHEGFDLHPDKTRVQRRGSRREVTGLVVSGPRVRIPRDVLRRFRATLYQIEKDGPQGKQWGRSKDMLAAVRGFANYVRMVDPDKGQALMQRVQALLDKHGWKPAVYCHRRKAAKPAEPSAQTPAPDAPREPEKPKKKWWKLW